MTSTDTAPPPPPPPPPAPPAHDTSRNENGGVLEDAAGALFAQISALGEGIRGGLKKATRGPVTDDANEKDQNKNANGDKDDLSTIAAEMKAKCKMAKNMGGEAKCALAGKKWTVEFQSGRNGDDMITLETDLKQTVYIYKCHDTIVKVSGKVNAIVMDSCEKSGCMFDEALASVELVNCKDVQLQCLKSAPAVSIDGCVSVCYYMSKTFKDAQIITAKSASINLVRPTEDDGTSSNLIPFIQTFPYQNTTFTPGNLCTPVTRDLLACACTCAAMFLFMCL